MASVYFDAAFGGVPMLVSSIGTIDGRDIAVLHPANGDKRVLRDRGRRHRAVSCELLFVEQPGQASYLERFDTFRALVEQPIAQVFSHPLLGAYDARIADFDHHADAESMRVEVSCTILAEDEPQAVSPAGAGVSAAAGVEAVEVASQAAAEAVASAGLTSSAPSACTTTVQGWSEADELDAQQVFLEAASRIEELNAELEVLSARLSDWPAYRALCVLRYQVARAAEAFTSEAERLVEITVGRNAPLLAICAEVYPPSLAVERARQAQKLNRVRTPGRVPAGTVLKLIAAGLRA